MSLGKYSKSGAKGSNETTRLLTVDDDEENENMSGSIFQDGENGDDESITSQDIRQFSWKEENEGEDEELLSVFTITCILSSSFAYGCIMTTLFLITLPIECERIEKQFPGIPKSVSSVVQRDLNTCVGVKSWAIIDDCWPDSLCKC